MNKNIEIITENLNILQSFCEKYEQFFQFVKPSNGPICFIGLKEKIDVMDFAEDVVKK